MDVEPVDTQEFIFGVAHLVSSKLTTEEKSVLSTKCDIAIQDLLSRNNPVYELDINTLWFIKSFCSR